MFSKSLIEPPRAASLGARPRRVNDSVTPVYAPGDGEARANERPNARPALARIPEVWEGAIARALSPIPSIPF